MRGAAIAKGSTGIPATTGQRRSHQTAAISNRVDGTRGCKIMADDLTQRDERELAKELEKRILAFLALPEPVVPSPENEEIRLQLELVLIRLRHSWVH
jgi:hypothetical protein